MDLYSPFVSSFTPDQLKINEDLANGKNIWIDMIESDYFYTMDCDSISSILSEFNTALEVTDYLSLEQYEEGMEGFISDTWFKFVQFIKKIIAHIKVMFNHFWSGINRKEAYLKNMKIKLRETENLNWLEMRDMELTGYSAEKFSEVLKACEKIEKVLENVFKDCSFDLDGIQDFSNYGIEFENGLIKKDGNIDEYNIDQKRFNLGLDPNANKALGLLGWDKTHVKDLLDDLLSHLQFHNKKDYLFIKFQQAAEALIRQKEHETKHDPEYIRRLKNAIPTVTSMMLYLTKLINTCTNQMVRMCNALEKEEKRKMKQEVEW